MGLPNAPGHLVSFDYFGPLPTTDSGNTYILLFTDRFSSHASMYAVTAADFTAAGTANILVYDYIKHYGCRNGSSPTMALSFVLTSRMSCISFTYPQNCDKRLPP